jgi:rhodanese-related sulfurtransferase
MAKKISCKEIASLMASDSLFAVFDVRERGEFNAGQIPNTTSLPRSQIEFRIGSLVPNRVIAVVVYDEGGERAELAAKTLAELGYKETAVLDGGLDSWRKEERPIISGVNVPSKAFGEKVHHEKRIPEISAEELRHLQHAAADLIVLDVRTPEEYGRFCIPGGLNVPGGDLVLWAEELRQKPDSLVIVNCAGRTRSIIGTAALRRLGLSNVRALRNGTMGWVLAGLNLESKPTRSARPASAQSREKATDLALRIAEEEGILRIATSELSRELEADLSPVTYLIDVRSEAEYEDGHIPRSVNVPGGQAVQRADDFIAVRNGRIVFVSNHSARAVMAAYWYRQMDFRDVRVLHGGLQAWRANGARVESGASRTEPLGLESARKIARLVQPAQVNSLLQDSSVTILHVGSSSDFEAAHLPGSQWISRGWLELKLHHFLTNPARPIMLSCANGRSSTLAARTLAELGYKEVFVLDGGVRAWLRAGYPTLIGLDGCLVEPNDVVLSPSIKGDKEAMRRYLEWELKLAR